MEGGGRLMAGGHFKIFKQVTGTKKRFLWQKWKVGKKQSDKYSMFDVP